MTAVAVVICTRDRPALLEGALDAACACLRSGDEVVVVDSCSRDPRATAPAGQHGLPVVRAARPGLSVARNLGVASSSAPIIAFTDDDCRPAPEWTSALDDAFAAESPTPGFVTGRAVPDRPTRLPVSVIGATARNRFGSGDDPFRCGTGANMAFSRQALASVGGFDEQLGAGAAFRSGEEVDMFWRLLRAGWTGRFEPDAVVVHQQWRTTSEAIRLGYGYGLGGGAVASKAIREDGWAGWRLLGHRLGRDGIAELARNGVRRYGSGSAMDVLLLAGTVAGAVRGARCYGGRRRARQS